MQTRSIRTKTGLHKYLRVYSYSQICCINVYEVMADMEQRARLGRGTKTSCSSPVTHSTPGDVTKTYWEDMAYNKYLEVNRIIPVLSNLSLFHYNYWHDLQQRYSLSEFWVSLLIFSCVKFKQNGIQMLTN